MNKNSANKLIKVLDWHKSDIEQKFGFKGGEYTDVNPWLSFFLGTMIWTIFYGAMFLLQEYKVTELFLGRGITPFFIVFLSTWSVAILLLKFSKMRFQKRALNLNVVPHVYDFVLAPATAKDILDRMYSLVDDVKKFVLLNRVERALSNLSNIGNVSDVSEMLSSQAENDEDRMESSYNIVKGFIWAIPVLGFIGTVMGLSSAIGRFGDVVQTSKDFTSITASLQNVTSGLSVAFDTTLIGLVAALVIQLVLTALKKQEEQFLDQCKEYCHANIVSKLRLIDSDENSR
jgi:biopolymer transport protein ExbB/TolQ